MQEVTSNRHLVARRLILIGPFKLELDAPISKYLADLPDRWSPITVRHLLTQTSGIQEEPHIFGQLVRESPQETLKLLQTFYPTEFVLLEPAKRSRLKHVPGEAWEYQNQRFTVAGKVIHSISDNTLREYAQDEVFRPLEMKSATFRHPGIIVPHLASCYALEAGKLKKAAPMNTDLILKIPGAGGMNCTLSDLIKLERALHEGRILKPATRDSMWTLAKTNSGQPAPAKWFDDETDTGYGMGWFVDGTNDHPWVFVLGSSGTVWVRLPKDGSSIIWLSNLRYSGQVIGRRDLVNLLVPELKSHTF